MSKDKAQHSTAQTIDEIVEQQTDVIPVDDLKWDIAPSDNDEQDKAVAIHTENSIILARGMVIDPVRTSPQRAMELMSMIGSYTGVTPVKAGDIVGRWHECLGACIVPFERRKKKVMEVVHGDTGEVTKEEIETTVKWEQALFKLARINDNGQHMIVSGGGQNAMELIDRMAQMNFVGDWPLHMWLLISQQETTIETLDPITKQPKKGPGRLYRVDLQMTKPSEG